MNIHLHRKTVYFTNFITYDYEDVLGSSEWRSYREYLTTSSNYNKEIQLYWNNLQVYLDHEVNEINGKRVNLDITHCAIEFRDNFNPYVQWLVNFSGSLVDGLNSYENIIQEEILEYPIYSLYVLHYPLQIEKIDSQLEYAINKPVNLVEFYGEKGKKVGPYEGMFFLAANQSD